MDLDKYLLKSAKGDKKFNYFCLTCDTLLTTGYSYRLITNKYNDLTLDIFKAIGFGALGVYHIIKYKKLNDKIKNLEKRIEEKKL